MVITFESGYFKFSGSLLRVKGSFDLKTFSPQRTRAELLEVTSAVETEAALREAEVMMANSRASAAEETLDLIHRLAALFPRSAVAGSRPLCDLGWLAYNRQVARPRGHHPSPRLYLACGISGAYQHIAGMKDSGFIVCINRDPRQRDGQWSDLRIEEGEVERVCPCSSKRCKSTGRAGAMTER